MKIIEVCPGPTIRSRGAEKFTIDLAKHLIKKGQDVSLLLGHNLDPALVKEFRFEKLFEVKNVVLRKLFFDYINPFAAIEFLRFLRNQNPDVIHFHGLYGLSSFLVWLGSRKAKTVVTFHDMWPVFFDPPPRTVKCDLANAYWRVPLGWIHRKLNQMFLRDAIIISPADWMIHYATARGFKNRFTHIPAATTNVSVGTSYQNEILWIGSLTEEKGLADALPILARVGSLHKWVVRVIGDGPLRSILENQYDNVNFHGWCDPHPYLKQASILVVSSIVCETGPLVLLDGMASGLCAIGRSKGGIKEIINHGFNGLLYTSDMELERALIRVIRDKTELKNIGQNAVSTVKRDFSWSKCVSAHMSVYSLE